MLKLGKKFFQMNLYSEIAHSIYRKITEYGHPSYLLNK